MDPPATWRRALERGALGLLLAVLALQAVVGLWDELERAANVPLAERLRVLGRDAAWRYENELGADYPLLLAIREHAGPDTLVLLAHERTLESSRSATRLLGLLFPLDVRLTERGASGKLPAPGGPVDLL